MRKLNTAIIGTGFMGRVHTEGVRRLGNVEVVAVAGSSDASAKKFADSIGIAKSTGDYRTLLDDPNLDAVHILTPNALHYSMSMAAMKAGKAVLCEKPLTMSAAEAREMVKLAEKKKLPNAVCHNLRYYPVVQHVRQMILAGDGRYWLSLDGYGATLDWAAHHLGVRGFGDVPQDPEEAEDGHTNLCRQEVEIIGLRRSSNYDRRLWRRAAAIG